ncbi:glycerate kinase [Jeotgalibacillus proteolyticus]|uniref:Glycerate kinase n=1 Tax=Jeotgalibacillus proteolyticus TaxID=2082395 RepID=A0A2S5GBM2_9BACL|nr:glycerate kinase [Jeotgalibacillus proteolyticus]PPA70315.1 glycerate kinase [Jeotgalibacillus proteolyticus]
MKIVLAPDSFKESITAIEACDAIKAGFKKVFPDAEYVSVPIADGGEGTVHSIVAATGGEIIETQATGPLGGQVEAFYGLTGDRKTAVIEMAAASGLHLVPRELRNPLLATTRGTGELILHALDLGVDRIVLGLGGSATNDGGAGMAQALGIRLLNEAGIELQPGGAALNSLSSIDISGMDARLKSVKVEVACDVTNPLTGPKGASAIFGPQKGASAEMVDILDASLSRYAAVIERDLGKGVNELPGAGAAGGLGAGIVAFLEGELVSGIDLILDVIRFEELVKDAALVITGEGKIDSQTIHGKAPIGVAKRTGMAGSASVIAVAGCLGEGYEAIFDHGIDAAFSVVNGACTLEDALAEGATNVEKTAENIARLWALGKK